MLLSLLLLPNCNFSRTRVFWVWLCVCVFYASFQSLLKHLVLNFSYDTFNRSFNFLLLLLGCWRLLLLRQRQHTADCDVCEYGLKLLLKSSCCCCCYYYFYYVSVSYWYCYFFLPCSWLCCSFVTLPTQSSELSDHDHNIFFWFTQHQCC